MRLMLALEEEGADLQRLAEDLIHLAGEIDQLDGAELSPVIAGDALAGARSGNGFEVAAVVVALGGPSLPALIGLLRDWLTRRAAGTIKLKLGEDELTIDRAPTDLQQQVLQEFLDRHRD
jgi:hypothetical protein